MTIKLTKVLDTYLEPDQTSTINFFGKIVDGFCNKAPSQVPGWVLNTSRSVLRSQ